MKTAPARPNRITAALYPRASRRSAVLGRLARGDVKMSRMDMIQPQFGIFAQGTGAHHFLEFDLRAGVTPAEAVPSFRRLRTPDVSAGGVNLVVAFGADAWRAVAPAEAPASLSA